MRKLLAGIINFRQEKIDNYRVEYKDLALGQKPDALMIACCDSRVAPNVFASTNPGDLFVVRNIGNLVPTEQSDHENSAIAAIDFSLLALNVKDIIICGHSNCGAMQALISGEMPSQSIASWLHAGKSSLAKMRETHANSCDHNLLSKYNVQQQILHLQSHPIVKEHLAQGKLRLHGWWLEVHTGDIFALNAHEQFQLLDEAYAKELLKTIT